MQRIKRTRTTQRTHTHTAQIKVARAATGKQAQEGLVEAAGGNESAEDQIAH